MSDKPEIIDPSDREPLIIFHYACDDGFAAAYITKFFTGGELCHGVYQRDPPDVRGRDVIFVDFCYKPDVMQRVITNARTVLVLDHHKTALEDCASLFQICPPTYKAARDLGLFHKPGQASAIFDMKRSGAGIAWDFFSNGAPRPMWVDYVEDRDLWLKKLPNGDEFTIALRSYPQDLVVWNDLLPIRPLDVPPPETPALGEPPVDPVQRLIGQGVGIQRYYRMRVDELKASGYLATMGNYVCFVANAPYFAASEVAGELALHPEAQFGAAYFEVSAGRWQYSLRARDDFDVSTVAKIYGGGGHKAAAGFTVDAPCHQLATPK